MTNTLNIVRHSDREYVSVQQVFAECPLTSFASPFELPEDKYGWARETFPPAYNPKTHKAAQAPVTGDRETGYVMAWRIDALSPEELAALAAEEDALRSAARQNVSGWRDEQERGGFVFEHDGRQWDGGKAVSDRMRPMLDLPEMPPGFFWTDANDNDVPVTHDDLEALYVAHQAELVYKGFEIHQRQRELKAAIEEMTPAQLRAFVPGWSA